MPSLARLSPPVLALLLGCGDSNEPSATYVGVYTATVLTITPDPFPTVDVLAGSGTLTIAIAADSTVTGQLFIPAAITGEDDLTESMAGIATITRTSVTFDQGADTFVRDLTFTRHSGYLTADQVLASDDARYVVRLERD
jgi:hypothetical protein